MEHFRPVLTAYAYNILGSYEDAKDIVQDTFLKFSQIRQDNIENTKAYLTRMVVNLAIDEKRKQKKRRAAYPGEWLPEPVATDGADSPINRKQVLSYSLMVLLEKLNIRQRAVFILKEAFEYEHEEIADVLGMSVENSRQTLSRAKQQLQSGAKTTGSADVPSEYLDRYLEIIRQGDVKKLEQLLSEEVHYVADGGGKVRAAVNPLHGKKPVLALLSGLYTKFLGHLRIERRWVNHQPAFLYYENDKLVTCEIVALHSGQVEHIYFVRNPDKLRSL